MTVSQQPLGIPYHREVEDAGGASYIDLKREPHSPMGVIRRAIECKHRCPLGCVGGLSALDGINAYANSGLLI